MLRPGWFSQLVLVAVVFSSACETRAEAPPQGGRSLNPPQGIAWFHDLYEAHKLSVDTGRPMLIFFTASWCHYCHDMQRKTLADPKMVSYVSANYIPVQLDADHDKRVAEILKVKPIPCTVVLSPNADILGKLVGFEDVPKYYGELEKARQRYLKMQQRR